MGRALLCLFAVVLACQEAPQESSVDQTAGRTSDDLKRIDDSRSLEQKWIPGQPGDGEYEFVSRFAARSRFFSDGRLLLWLDTATSPAKQKTPRRHFALADSVSVSNLAPGEFFTEYCRINEGLADGQIGGIARTLEPGQWEKPRLAWRFDTLSSRIRPIPPDSVFCAVPEPD
jgi:hypothetical protein